MCADWRKPSQTTKLSPIETRLEVPRGRLPRFRHSQFTLEWIDHGNAPDTPLQPLLGADTVRAVVHRLNGVLHGGYRATDQRRRGPAHVLKVRGSFRRCRWRIYPHPFRRRQRALQRCSRRAPHWALGIRGSGPGDFVYRGREYLRFLSEKLDTFVKTLNRAP